MNARLSNRLADLEAAASPPAPGDDQPDVPPEFTGKMFYGNGVRILIPDNGRGPADYPKPNIVRIGTLA